MRPTLEALEARALPAPLGLAESVAQADSVLSATVARLLPTVAQAQAELIAAPTPVQLTAALSVLRSSWQALEGPLAVDLILRDLGHPNFAQDVDALLAGFSAIDGLFDNPPTLS